MDYQELGMKSIKQLAVTRARRTVWLDRRRIARLKAKAEPGGDLDRWLDRHEAVTRHDDEHLAEQIRRALKDESSRAHRVVSL